MRLWLRLGRRGSRLLRADEGRYLIVRSILQFLMLVHTRSEASLSGSQKTEEKGKITDEDFIHTIISGKKNRNHRNPDHLPSATAPCGEDSR